MLMLSIHILLHYTQLTLPSISLLVAVIPLIIVFYMKRVDGISFSAPYSWNIFQLTFKLDAVISLIQCLQTTLCSYVTVFSYLHSSFWHCSLLAVYHFQHFFPIHLLFCHSVSYLL